MASSISVPPRDSRPSIHTSASRRFFSLYVEKSVAKRSTRSSNAMSLNRSPVRSPCSAPTSAVFAACSFSPCIEPEMSTANTASRGNPCAIIPAGGSTSTSVCEPLVHARVTGAALSAVENSRMKSLFRVARAEGATRTPPASSASLTACKLLSTVLTGPAICTSRSSRVPPSKRIGGLKRDAFGTRSVSASTPNPL